MRKFVQNKLWRNKLVAKMESMGSRIHSIYLTDHEFDVQLRIKLLEEVAEVQQAASREVLIEELADVFEVIEEIKKLNKISTAEIEAAQTKKRQERGGFDERKFVTIAEHPAGSFGEQYCLADPAKYKEIKD